ncbi:MAG: helix-turn-helix transcriptional regulator [Lachnospiraceae bacterium]|nr:helix-turn-helix transcriptional regulator [Lachnospiraceae bacterium]
MEARIIGERENILNHQFSISQVKRNPYFDMREAHVHPYYELYYLISGKRRIFVNHTIYLVNKGDIVAIEKGALHRTTYLADKTHERINIHFTDEFIEPLFAEFGKETVLKCFKNPHMTIPASRREYVDNLMQRMEYEFKLPDAFSKHLLKNHLYELLIFLIRCQEFQYSTMEELDAVDEVIQEVAKYICMNYNTQITLEDAAKQANMSAAYFSRKFKRTTGFGFKEYLSNVRLKEAATLLLETNDSITDIALRCGYNDSNYFGDVFKKMKGMSPYQYRKNKGVV